MKMDNFDRSSLRVVRRLCGVRYALLFRKVMRAEGHVTRSWQQRENGKRVLQFVFEGSTNEYGFPVKV